MEKEAIDNYRKAGDIVKKVIEEVRPKLRPGAKLLDIAEFIEKRTLEMGGRPAFPVNVSINEIAAHYTPTFNDQKIIQTGDLVKVDIGVQVDGYTADTAITCCSEKNLLIDSAEKALEAARKVVRPGVKVWEISEAIESSIKEDGFGPIVNLTGHTIDKNIFHGNVAIPNINNRSQVEIVEGDVIAIEPFVAKTAGHVKDSANPEIFRYLADKPVRMMEARQILDVIRKEYTVFPFAKRWLCGKFSEFKVTLALRQLEMAGAIESFPPLKEVENRPIAQAEDTIIVLEKPVVIT